MNEEETIQILKEIIKGDEDCIEMISKFISNNKEDDEDIEHYKREIQGITNIINYYKREKARADKLEKDDSDSLIAFKENLYEQTVKENIKLKKQIAQLESDKQKLIEKLEKDIREETGYARWTNSYTKEISPAVTKMISKSKYAQEILSILKGE